MYRDSMLMECGNNTTGILLGHEAFVNIEKANLEPSLLLLYPATTVWKKKQQMASASSSASYQSFIKVMEGHYDYSFFRNMCRRYIHQIR